MSIYQILTFCEQQVADELIMGKTNRQIAKATGYSYWKVRFIIGNLFISYNARNRTELAKKVLEDKM